MHHILLCRDPNLWMVRCRMGEEKQVVFALMRKSITFQNSETVTGNHQGFFKLNQIIRQCIFLQLQS